MSKENVETFKRAFEALNRRDIEAMLKWYDPEVEARYALEARLGGEAVVHRGHGGVREAFQSLTDTFAEFHYEFSEIRDLGDRVFAIGRLSTRGRESGAEAESPIAYVIDFKDGEVIRSRSYLDPNDALEAAGLEE